MKSKSSLSGVRGCRKKTFKEKWKITGSIKREVGMIMLIVFIYAKYVIWNNSSFPLVGALDSGSFV